MARRRGAQADSREDLLAAAWQLTLERGTAGLSVEAIVARAGLSKGTFFHFFPAKQQFLDALCARIADESWRRTGKALGRRDLDPVARLDLFFRSSRSWRSEHSAGIGALWRELARPPNAALRARVRALGIERLAPRVVAVLAEANARGTARVRDAETAGRLLVEWVFTAAEGTMQLLSERPAAEAVELAVRRADTVMEAFERMLGVPDGSFQRVDRGLVSKLAAGLESAEASSSRAVPSARNPPGPGIRGRRKARSGHDT